jgi:predicted amidohydrolase YtcJ
MPQADLILRNARVLVGGEGPPATLVAVSGDKIAAVTGEGDFESLAGPRTRVIDGGGRALAPGFNDAHLHLFSLVASLRGIDLRPPRVDSIAAIEEAVRRQASQTPPGTWLSGSGYDEFYLKEKRHPTRRDLDGAAPDHPVVLSHRSLHACVLNSRALKLAGIGIETEELPGARIERDLPSGEPNGVLYGMLGYLRDKVMPPLAAAELDEGISLADRHLLAHGITSFQDASVSNDLKRWGVLRGFQETGRLRSRITMMAGAPHLAEFREAGMKTGSGDEQLRLGAVKLVPGIDSGQEDLNRLALECHQSGFQLAFHAVAEREVAAVITALEYIAGQASWRGRRPRIEHASECPPQLLERIRKLGAVIVTQPPFIHYSGERYLATVPPGQLPWLYRIRAPLKAGVVVAASSDAPVAPLDPLVGIYAAVTRRAASGQRLLPEEAINPWQALGLYTTGGAYASFEEAVKGSIAPGQLADLVLLGDDLTTCPPERIKDIKVEMTIVSGEVVWEG